MFVTLCCNEETRCFFSRNVCKRAEHFNFTEFVMSEVQSVGARVSRIFNAFHVLYFVMSKRTYAAVVVVDDLG